MAVTEKAATEPEHKVCVVVGWAVIAAALLTPSAEIELVRGVPQPVAVTSTV